MSRRSDLKIVVDNEMREPPVPLPEKRPHNDLLQTILGFAISLPLWGLVVWIVWMWWTGRV